MNKYLFKKLATIFIAFVIIAIAIVGGYLFMHPQDGRIVSGDYTILKGHYGKIDTYDPAVAVEGYEGGIDKAYYVFGKIKASEDKRFTVITFNLYDENNKLLGNAVAGLDHLSKNKIYEFKALSLVSSADMEKISYYKINNIR